MSSKLKLKSTAGGSRSLVIDDTITDDAEIDVSVGGIGVNHTWRDALTGVMFDFGGANAPDGALACNGQEVAIEDYPELYAAIGDIWNNTGGASNPSEGNFRVPLSQIDGVGLFTKGKTSSDNVGDSQTSQNKAHTHTGPSHTHTGPSHTHTGPSHTHSANHNHSGSSNSTGAHTHSVTGSPDTRAVNRYISGAATVTVALQGGVTTSSAGSHSHSITVNTKTMNTGAGGTNNTGASGNAATSSSGTGSTSSNGGTESRPQNITVLKCIWTGQPQGNIMRAKEMYSQIQHKTKDKV